VWSDRFIFIGIISDKNFNKQVKGAILNSAFSFLSGVFTNFA